MSVVFAAASVLLLAVASAGLDFAMMFLVRSQLQDVADAAALHAVREMTLRGAGAETAENIARNYVQSVIGTVVPADTAVTITPAVLSTQPAKMKVSLSAEAPVPFGIFVQDSRVSVTAEAIEAERLPVSLLLLNPTDNAVWSMSGTADVIAVEGVAHVNSSSPAALSGKGSAAVHTDNTLVVGPEQPADNWSPQPVFDASPAPDPWKNSVVWPNPSSCDYVDRVVKNQTVTLSPGVYCGGLSLETHAKVTLLPGVYILKNGDLQVVSGSSLSGPTDVTIVLLGEGSQVLVQAGALVTLTAPKEGPWAHLAIAAQPTVSPVTSTLIGGGELVLDGVVYLPKHTLSVTGGGDAQSQTGARIFAVDKINMSGNGQIFLRGDADILSKATGSRLVR